MRFLCGRFAGLQLSLMLALTFSTGVIDAVGFLGLDRVFTGNMTGNVVILAMAMTGADDLPVMGPLIALALFVAGAAVAGRVLRGLPAGWSRRTTVLLVGVSVVLIASASLGLVYDQSPSDPLMWGITAALGFSMGIQAGVARHIAVADITTVVFTSTLVGLAFDSKFGRGTPSHPWARRLLAIVVLGAGAAAGALLLRFGIAPVVFAAAAVTLVVAILGALSRE